MGITMEETSSSGSAFWRGIDLSVTGIYHNGLKRMSGHSLSFNST